MSLYIRLYTDFWNHKKTMKLKTLIGTDAFWVMPRLWSYAAENQIDGDFSQYSSSVLSEILGCPQHAPSLLQALNDSGFMMDNRLNDWMSHNAFHAVNSERAKKAAIARHSKEKSPTPSKEENTKTETERAGYRASSKLAPSMLQAGFSLNSLEIPDILNTKDFLDIWRTWVPFRLKMKKPKDPDVMFSQQLKTLSMWGPVDAVKSLEESIANGWQGIFKPKERRGQVGIIQNSSNQIKNNGF